MSEEQMIWKRLSLILPAIFLAITFVGCVETQEALKPDGVEVIKEYDISGLGGPWKENVHTVDMVIFHSDQTEVTWEELQEEFLKADRIFRSYGVQLNLIKALDVTHPANWKGMHAGKATNKPHDEIDLDFYDLIDYGEDYLPEELESIFNAFLSDEDLSERTIYIIPLSDLTISWFEKNESDHWIEVQATTSAISFPPYMLADRIPKQLRGVISFQRSRESRRTMAHELGHKLINVSHEGLDVCPKGDGTDIPGLMGYGESLEIFGGEEGRWHQERLLRSPFLYRIVDGQKVWNDEYENGGTYDDPIYESLTVKPACPEF
jgi:hypothetical protein